MACCADDIEETKEGVVVNRRCRDVICLLFFIVFWADLLTPDTLPFAKSICVDSCPGADLCSIGSFPCTNPKAYRCPYYAVAEDNLYGEIPGLPVSSTQYFSNLTSITHASDPTAAVFLKALQKLNLAWITSFLSSYHINASNPGGLSGAYYQLTSQFPGEGPCYPVWVPTTDDLNRCVPELTENFTKSVVSLANKITNALPAGAADVFANEWNNFSSQMSRYISDTSRGIFIIVIAGIICSFLFCMFWLITLRYFAGLIVWLIIITVNVLLVGSALYCFSMAGLLGSSSISQTFHNSLSQYGSPNTVSESTWKAIAITAAVIAGIVFLITLLMISRIKIAVACIKVASQAVGAMPSIIFFPILPFCFEIALVIYWLAVTALLYTAGYLNATCRNPASAQSFSFSTLQNFSSSSLLNSTQQPSTVSCYTNATGNELQLLCGSDPNCYLSYTWDNTLEYAFIYHFFGLLWTSQFFVGMAYVTISGAIGFYYWAGGDSKKMPAFPVMVAMKNTFVYSLGSIAFGSLIVAIVLFIRIVLEYIDNQTKKLQNANAIAKWLMCCIKCCAWCLEKIVMFINRNAFIIVGIKGSNYCAAACTALKLILTNALRLLAVNIIGDILLLLGKLIVASGCGLVAFGLSQLQYYSDADQYPNTTLSSPIFPIAFSILIAFIVAQIFFAVFELAIDTTLLAFCEDCDRNGGNPKWAPPLLMEAMGVEKSSNTAHNAPEGQGVHPVASKGNAVAPEPAIHTR
ncbi:hypothetical protein CEUSTIGMA_g10093.t1 [Chlamydomonas eustigma]|uniref:Choline transporter-like protein n=1 Tax=Chlamydomonas eustigma TaxID=1157962 RepID=A0A250XHV6_9CHLO|nr:hypothetical protein CEUSTIGMA_g10093.t1 [Chlamydomonas eustigma]|eukprot:GAX82667.1 hypothetical protein CEUSTIGMA_g10093.t1 [Chlamydomonas eustigma]